MTKKLIFILLCTADAFTLYLSVGYALRAALGAKLVGADTAHFVGYYMLSAPFSAVFIICAVFTVVLMISFIRKGNSNKK